MNFNQAELRLTFSYDRGMLYYNKSSNPVAVTRQGDAIIGGVKVRLRDLVWVYHYGAIPSNKQVEHLNEDADDAYIDSLRLVEQEEVCYE